MAVGLAGMLVGAAAGCHDSGAENPPRPAPRTPTTAPAGAPSGGGEAPGERGAPDDAKSGDAEAGSGGRERSSDRRRGAPPPYRPHRLETLFRALDATESGEADERVTILQVGDSHTASDTITGRIRRLFQDKFGSAGRGYTYPGKPWGSFRQEQTDYAMSPEWEPALGIVDAPSPPFAAGGVRVETRTEGAWLERTSCGYDDRGESRDDEEAEECRYGRSFDRYAIFYHVRPKGGSFTVSVDGESPTVVETSGTDRGLGVFERGVEPGPHRIHLEAAGDGPVGLFGIRTLHGEAGVEYVSLGVNGATAGDFASFDRRLTRREIEELAPELMIVAFGTNEAYNLYEMHTDPDHTVGEITRRLADYQFQFEQLLERYRSAAPEASCLVMLPPDAAPERDSVGCRERVEVGEDEVCIPPTLRSYAGIVAIQRTAAERAGCAVWDQSHAMGGAGSIRYWAALTPSLARDDGIHLTMDGYHLLGEAFFSDLMRTYQMWRDGGQMPLETRRISPPGGPETGGRFEADVFDPGENAR